MDKHDIQRQTLEIVKCLFEDDVIQATDYCLETDGDDTFDAAPIANKLKKVADQMQKDKEFQAAYHQFKQEQLQQAIYTFSQTVERCQVPVSAEVAPELQLIKTAVALCRYVMKKAPELRAMMEQATASFLTTPRLDDFVARRGGWRAVADAVARQ